MCLTTIQSFKIRSVDATGIDMLITYTYIKHEGEDIRTFSDSKLDKTAKSLVDGDTFKDNHHALVERLLYFANRADKTIERFDEEKVPAFRQALDIRNEQLQMVADAVRWACSGNTSNAQRTAILNALDEKLYRMGFKSDIVPEDVKPHDEEAFKDATF